jgi:hypothetical protein
MITSNYAADLAIKATESILDDILLKIEEEAKKGKLILRLNRNTVPDIVSRQLEQCGFKVDISLKHNTVWIKW